MGGEENITSFAVETDEILKALRVAAAKNHQSEVDAQTLHALCGGNGATVSARGFAELGCETYRTIFRCGIGN